MSRWSDRAWEAAAPTFRRILEHPFVHELAAGTLPAEKFRFYIRQDALYLDGYARRLAHIAARLPRKEQTETFLHFALEGIEVERALHAQFLDGGHPSPEEISPACLLYTSVLDAQATAPVEVEAAAVLPCLWSTSVWARRSCTAPVWKDTPTQPGSRPMPIRDLPRRPDAPQRSATSWPRQPATKSAAA